MLQETELRYYDAETDAEPKCVIQLDNMILDTSNQVASKLGKPHSFILNIDARQVCCNNFRFFCATPIARPHDI